MKVQKVKISIEGSMKAVIFKLSDNNRVKYYLRTETSAHEITVYRWGQWRDGKWGFYDYGLEANREILDIYFDSAEGGVVEATEEEIKEII